MAITLATAQEHLDAWLAAELAILEGAQSYTIGSRVLTRVNASYLKERIAYWENKVAQLTAGRAAGPRARRFIPRDL